MNASSFLREARERAQLTQAELADRLGLSKSTVSLREAGKRGVTARDLVEAGRVCGVPDAEVRSAVEALAGLRTEAA